MSSMSLLHAVSGGTRPVMIHGIELARFHVPRRGFVGRLWRCVDVILGVNAFMDVLTAVSDDRQHDP